MLSSSLDTLLKVSKTTYLNKLFAYDCVTLYICIQILFTNKYSINKISRMFKKYTQPSKF